MTPLKRRMVWAALAALVVVVMVRDAHKIPSSASETPAQRRAEWHLDGMQTAKVRTQKFKKHENILA